MEIYKNLKDEEVVRLVCEKNKEIYTEIIRRYQDKLRRYIFNLIQDDNKTEDILQETFIKAYINLRGFNRSKKFSSWIYRIAHNETINMIKKDKKQISLENNLDFDSGIDIEEGLIKKELRLKTHRCLKQMPVDYREVITLYYLEEKSYEEISDILRVPVATIGTRIRRAKILMKKICQKK
ncbi:MAG: RNA polymerase sigma factor SigW [Candidatus Woesebacteria bacterium]|jgi:RNA polymerase sigma-70 factor (ECF subfamily)|nr:MAG: RNA polymerase sigma factor SigW [Candidatus Woesebacteria bacterium]